MTTRLDRVAAGIAPWWGLGSPAMAAPLRNLLDGIVRQEQPGAWPGPIGVERTVRSQDPATPFRAGPV